VTLQRFCAGLRIFAFRLIGRRWRPTFLRLLATAALQSMTPHILSSRGARVRPLRRLTRLLQLPHAPNGCAY
jgi:hypothetical protein